MNSSPGNSEELSGHLTYIEIVNVSAVHEQPQLEPECKLGLCVISLTSQNSSILNPDYRSPMQAFKVTVL